MRIFSFIILIAFCFSLGGCFEEIGQGVNEFTAGLFRVDAKAQATIAEIDAVGRLKSYVAKLDGFLAIAKRGGLSSQGQVHLVEISLNKLSNDYAKVKVLLTLINNADFCHESKMKILHSLCKLKSEDDREVIVGAINNRVIGVKKDIPPSEGKIQAVLSTDH